MADAALQEWLASAPVNVPVDLYDETFFLNIHPDGAELGARFVERFNEAQLTASLQMGFASATIYKAGLAICSKSGSLVLTEWLPNVKCWRDAARQVEDLWGQLKNWREALETESQRRVATIHMSRSEHRMRNLLQSKKTA